MVPYKATFNDNRARLIRNLEISPKPCSLDLRRATTFWFYDEVQLYHKILKHAELQVRMSFAIESLIPEGESTYFRAQPQRAGCEAPGAGIGGYD
ncbi:hypothetical protein DOTSEDRAFT_69131 [Dothistroma septosporum NZE10]|uniref:Uncharacterized protein n=1 Tax=Dothistroma septosporum (strain NZE10 / CBS 128990) TaxID=675120 RepID=N1PXW1_DOTSN|nr:hypothetical protein DOTSEDRAFT_69131 [Dothistroma septosporum NZE10]